MTMPLGYLLTWTTYGTWLSGDERGWVESGKFGVKPGDPNRQELAECLMIDDAVTLDPDQRRVVEDTIRAHCLIRQWELHAVNARSNHVHVVVSAGVAPEKVMSQFKAWCSRRLSEHAGLASVSSKNGAKRWWTEHGSTKWINDDEYLTNAIRYVQEGQ